MASRLAAGLASAASRRASRFCHSRTRSCRSRASAASSGIGRGPARRHLRKRLRRIRALRPLRGLEHLRSEGSAGRRAAGGQAVGGLNECLELGAGQLRLGLLPAASADLQSAAQRAPGQPRGIAPKELYGLYEIALLESKQAQRVSGIQRIRMFGAQHMLAAFERSPQKRCRIRVAAPSQVESAKTGGGRNSSGVIRSQHAGTHSNGRLEQGFCLVIMPHSHVQGGEVAGPKKRVWVFFAKHAFRYLEGALEKRFR